MDAVIGANGLVGHALMRHLDDAVGTYNNCKDNLLEGRKYEWLDITDNKKVDEFFSTHKPKKVFLAAANAWVDGCENYATDKVNIGGVGRIITNAHAIDAQVIFFSSSYVFDGESQVPYKTTDETLPINRYGRQKERIEKMMQGREGLQWLIIRTVGVFGHEGSAKNFVSQVHKAFTENKKLYVPSDQTMNPVWSNDLARTTIHLSNRYTGKIFHVAGNKCLSKYEFAINVAYKLGCKKPHELVVGMKSENMKQMALRPKNGCLDCGSLQAHAIAVPNFEKSLWRFVGEEYGIKKPVPA